MGQALERSWRSSPSVVQAKYLEVDREKPSHEHSLCFPASIPISFESAAPLWAIPCMYRFLFHELGDHLRRPRRGYSRADAPNTLASGTKLYVRLETAVSTKTSHLNQAVTARVVREVTSDQGVLVPIGAEVTGKIEKLIPASDPTDHARLLIHFTQLAIPRHPTA